MFTLDDSAKVKDWTSTCLGLEFTVSSLTDALGALMDDVTPASQVCHVFMFSTFEPCLYNSNLIFS